MATRPHGHASHPRVLVPVANASEDIEVASVVDVLRRAGVAVTVAAIGGSGDGHRTVVLARGCVLVADAAIADAASAAPYDMICVPGGMPGAAHLRDDRELTALLLGQAKAGRPLAAICAAPAVVLAAHGLLGADSVATAHAGFIDKLPGTRGAELRVAIDRGAGRVTITSRGPGTAIEWALACVGELCGPAKAAEVAGGLHLHPAQLAALGGNA